MTDDTKEDPLLILAGKLSSYNFATQHPDVALAWLKEHQAELIAAFAVDSDVLTAALKNLPHDSDRYAVFSAFCGSCGSLDPYCKCWNHE